MPNEVLDQPVFIATGGDDFGETALYPIADLVGRLAEDARFSGGYEGPVLLASAPAAVESELGETYRMPDIFLIDTDQE